MRYNHYELSEKIRETKKLIAMNQKCIDDAYRIGGHEIGRRTGETFWPMIRQLENDLEEYTVKLDSMYASG